MDGYAQQAFEAGLAKARGGDPLGAAAAFTEALDREPNWTLARLNRGVAWFLGRDFPAALADFDAALAADPTLVDAYLNRSAVRRITGDAAGADADLAKAAELAPDNPAVVQSRAAARLRAGDAAGAEADFTRVLDQNPRVLVARVNRAAARIQLGNLAGAVEDADAALAADPRNRDGLVNRATARILLRDYPAAAADAAAVLAIDPASIEGLYIRGVARTGLEKFADALADLEAVVKKAPGLAAGWAARGNAKYHLGDPTAADDYREAFKLDALAATRVVLRLVREQAKHEPNKVLAECQKFRTRDRRDAISLARRGLTRVFQGRPADANLDFAAFRRLTPTDGEILDLLIAAAEKVEKIEASEEGVSRSGRRGFRLTFRPKSTRFRDFFRHFSAPTIPPKSNLKSYRAQKFRRPIAAGNEALIAIRGYGLSIFLFPANPRLVINLLHCDSDPDC